MLNITLSVPNPSRICSTPPWPWLGLFRLSGLAVLRLTGAARHPASPCLLPPWWAALHHSPVHRRTSSHTNSCTIDSHSPARRVILRQRSEASFPIRLFVLTANDVPREGARLSLQPRGQPNPTWCFRLPVCVHIIITDQGGHSRLALSSLKASVLLSCLLFISDLALRCSIVSGMAFRSF